MGQAKPLQNQPPEIRSGEDQPTMDEILASIRRIIDRGPDPAQPEAPANHVDRPDIKADKTDMAVPDTGNVAPPSAPQPSTPQPLRPPMSETELDRFSQALDARAPLNPGNEQIVDAVAATLEQRVAKYQARFTEDDNRAFQAVASALSATSPSSEQIDQSSDLSARHENAVTITPAAEAGTEPLLSEPIRDKVGASFDVLSDVLKANAGRDLEEMAEQMLRPMLSDWLDNNLPAIVERLVRAEIEAIARGAPHKG